MSIKQHYSLIVLLSVFAITAIVMSFADPIAQDLTYHNFSDDRVIFDIPYFMDVMSNMPFIVLGVLGFLVVGKAYKNKPMAFFLMTFTFFVGVFLTGVGSAFYHYAPNNFSLIFDRLPMTLIFTPFFATIIYDYVDRRAGALIFYGLLLLGVYSILYWYYTELMGAGDLRLYAFVQFFPVVAVPLILIFYNNSKLYTKQIIYAFGAYTMAKLCEHFDTEIFEALKVVSGHTIKHLFSALSVYYIYRIYKIRIIQSE